MRGIGDQEKPHSLRFLETSQAYSFGDDLGRHSTDHEGDDKKASGVQEAFIRGAEQNAQFASINAQNNICTKSGFEKIGCNLMRKFRRKRFQIDFEKIASPCVLSQIATFLDEVEWFEFICVSKYMFREGDQRWKYVWKHDPISDYKVGCRLKRYLQVTQDCVYNIMDNITSRRILRAAMEAIVEAELVEHSIIIDVAKDYGFFELWKHLVSESLSI